MKKQNIYTDFDKSKALNRLTEQYNDRYSGKSNLIVRIISQFIGSALNGIPVSYRLLMRRRIGMLTLSPFSIIMAFVWILSIVIFTGQTVEMPSWWEILFGQYWLSLVQDENGGDIGIIVFRYAAYIASLCVLVRGFLIYWIIGPFRVRYHDKFNYNPISLGIASWTRDEYHEQSSLFGGIKRKRLLYERVEGPLILSAIGVILMLISKFLLPEENSLGLPTALYSLGFFFFVSAIGVLIEASRVKRQLIQAKLLEISSRALGKEMEAEFKSLKNIQPDQKDFSPIRYIGKY